MIQENLTDFIQAFWKLLTFLFADGFDRSQRFDEFDSSLWTDTLQSWMEISSNHNGQIDQLLT